MRKKIIISAMALGALTLLGAGCVNKSAKNTIPEMSLSILASDQKMEAGNQISIDSTSITDDGWVVVHKITDGKPGPVIGYTSLASGSASDLKITVDKTNLTPSLIAMLHYDRGEKGVFEFPGADGPAIKDQQVIMKEFKILNYADAGKQSSQDKPVSARKEFVVTAKQWSFSPSVIKVKKGDTVVLKMISVDVAHGVYIPDFGINATIKPGETNIVEFVADKTGTFAFSCNIPCGVGHKAMTGTIVVE